MIVANPKVMHAMKPGKRELKDMHRFRQISAILVLLLLMAPLGMNSLTTEAQTSPTEPILLVVNNSAPYQFGAYLGEILMAEGISSFATASIGSLTAADLTGRDLVILAETALTAGQAALINDYYAAGGRLLAMRPDPQIAGLFGLGSTAGTQDRAYLRIINSAIVNGEAPGQGITNQTIQYHGTATLYNTLAGAVTIAQLYSNATTPINFPAVVSTSDGTAAAFTYDLARSIVYMRQGNPANANIDTDGDGIFRTRDLYLSADGNHWVDRTRLPIVQADEQQRLFARLVRQAVESARPLPRLWYFPGTARTVLIATSDAHANPISWHEELHDAVSDYGGTVTTYLSIGAPANADIQAWRAQGHEFGIHPFPYRPDSYPPFNVENIVEGYYVASNWYTTSYTSPPSRTVRAHDIGWLGWTDAAELGLQYGVKFNTDLFTVGRWLQLPDGSWPHGYMNGSGQPMRMIREDGVILDYYQQSTSLLDIQLLCQLGDNGQGYENLNNTTAMNVSRELIDNSQAGGYSAIVAFFQVDCIGYGTTPWVRDTLAYAQSVGAPILNADRFLEFTETRYETEYSNIAWNGTTNTLTFNMSAPASSFNVSTIIPLNYNGRGLSAVTVDGSPVNFSVQNIKGRDEAFVTVTAGNRSFSAVYDNELISPTPTWTPTNTPTATPTNTPTPISTGPSLTTLFAHDGRQFHGNMFDVTVINPLQITGFEVNVGSGNTTVSVYYRNGSYVGSEANAAAWTLMGSANVVGAGPNNRTAVPISGPVLPPGTYGFYVTVTPIFSVASSVDMYYTSGSRTVANADLSLTAGVGIGGLFADPAACQARSFPNNPCVFQDRTWNGTIFYQLGVTPTATPTSVPVAGTPVGTVDQTSVTVNENQPAVNTGTFSDPQNDAITLSASVGTVVDTGSGNWIWNYTPDDGPINSQTVIISASDGLNTGQVSFTLVVNNVPPVATFTNTSGIIYAGQSATLSFSAEVDTSAADTLAGFLYSYDCTNDGGFELVSSASSTFNCTYTSAGDYTARGRIADKDGGSSDYTVVISVQPQMPTATPAPGTYSTTLQISAGSDDVNEDGAAFEVNGPTVWVGNGQSTSASYLGLRFNNVPVPPGAVVDNAYVQFYSPYGGWVSMAAEIAAVAADNSATFSSSNRPSQLPLTTARVQHGSNVNWSAGNWYNFNEMRTVVQEVVNRPGWQAGSSLSVIIRGTSTAYARKIVSAYEGSPANAPRLVLVYTIPGAPTATPTNPPTATPTNTPTATATSTPDTVQSLTTLFAHDGRQFHGNMFNVTVTNPLQITSFDVNIGSGSTTVSVYYRSGSYVGSEANAAAWTLLGSANVVGAGPNNRTAVPISSPVLQPGTYGFYVAVTPTFNINTSVDMYYTSGNRTVSNADLSLTAGIGVGGLFGDPAACQARNFSNNPCIFADRSWNGTIYYQVQSVAPTATPTNPPTATPTNPPTATNTPAPTATSTPLPQPPVAAFAPSVTSGEAPLAVQFTNSSSGEITTYAWTFGDGGSSAEASPAYTYTAPGTYTVTLTVSGPGGQNSAQATITVNAPPPTATQTPTEEPTPTE
jgi:PKD repeat protein